MEEKRRQIRLSVSGEGVYRIQGLFSLPKTVIIKEISKDGLRFVAQEKLAEETVLELVIQITNISDPIIATGKVIWQRELSSRFLLDTSVKIISINADNENKLVRYIYQFAKNTSVNRKGVRCPLETKVQYHCLNDNTAEKECVSTDISIEGMKLIINETIPIETKLRLGFDLPGIPTRIYLKGEVVWAKDDEISTIGIQFFELKLEDKKKIASYIAHKLKKSK
ncbi:MAG: PilZ domain-containing protein [Candidatus Omnitrophota bacterium]